MLSADTGVRSQKLFGDFAIILPADKNGRLRHHMPAGQLWKHTVDAQTQPDTIYRGCIQLSPDQPYSVLDAVLRIDVARSVLS